MSKVLITGINGQDSSYLAEYMLELGHEVHGIIRRHSDTLNQQSRLSAIQDKITAHYGDMTDTNSIENVLAEVVPDYVFNIAAQSHVQVSWTIPVYTVDVNATGTLRLLDACRRIVPKAKFYQATSSECFGLSVDDDKFQRETTQMNPTSPYGCSKVFAYNITRHYRRAFGMHACNGILFNHTSVRRGMNFVEQKICHAVAQIKLGLLDKLELGNMDSYRDIGASWDYVRAMWLIMNHLKADDFVIATGETHSVRDVCKTAFGYVGLDYNDYVVQNPKFMRPEELPYLRGDATRARVILGWEPKYTFDMLMKEMVDHWLKELSK